MNGWHYWNFSPTESEKQSIVNGIQVTEKFSVISRIEMPTEKEVKFFFVLGAQALTIDYYEALKGILYAEVVQLYYNGRWADMEIQRETFRVRVNDQNAYEIICRAELLNVGDIESALIVPDIEEEENLGAETLYEEGFEGSPYFGYNFAAGPSGNTLTQETIGGDETGEVFLVADPLNGINDSVIIITKELTDYAFNYGNIKSTINISVISSLTAISYQLVGGFYQLYLTVGVGGDVTAGNYAAKKKVYEKTQVFTQDAPLRYVQIRFSNTSKSLLPASIDVHAYIDNVKIERL